MKWLLVLLFSTVSWGRELTTISGVTTTSFTNTISGPIRFVYPNGKDASEDAKAFEAIYEMVDPDELAVMYHQDGDIVLTVRNSKSYAKWKQRGWVDMKSMYPVEKSRFYTTQLKMQKRFELQRKIQERDEKSVQSNTK